MPAVFDQFAERLGVGIDVLEQFVAGVAPTRQAVAQDADLLVSQVLELTGGVIGQVFAARGAIVIDDQQDVAARNAPMGFGGYAAQRDLGGEQGMAKGELGFLAYVDQGDFFTAQQG